MTVDAPTDEHVQRSIRLTLFSAAGYSVWFQVCAPQQIFNVFVGTYLLPSDGALGLLVGTISFMSVFQLVSIFLYQYLARRKRFWFVMSLLHRLNSFVLAAVAFSVGRGGSREIAYAVVFVTMTVSWMLAQASGSGWWSWMADLFPERIRSTVFGKRSAVSAVVNLVWFFAVTGALNVVPDRAVYDLFAIVFLIGGIGGLADILVHAGIPEPSKRTRVIPAAERLATAFADFAVPLRDARFRRFVLFTGLALTGLSMVVPFIPTFITAERGLGARPIWMAFQFGILQLTWLIMVPVWGIMMDRFGKRPVVIIGLAYCLHWTGYLVIDTTNYHWVLPLISAIGGLLAPGFWEGINQWSIMLASEEQRISYVAWFWTAVGVFTAIGTYTGGALLELFAAARTGSFGPVTFGPFQLVILISLVVVACSAVLLARIPEPEGKRIRFVVRRVSNPNFFRTFATMQVMSSSRDSLAISRALRSIDAGTGEIAVDEVIERLGDPDPDVRAEAARALGRIRAAEAVDALIGELREPSSTVRPEAAAALGRIGDKRAMSALFEALADPSEALQDAAAWALGEIGDDTAVEQLLSLFRQVRSERISAASAAAISRLGRFEAAWEFIPRMHETRNPILRTQLAIALGDLMGRPGEFYRFVSGSAAEQRDRRKRLFADARRNVAELIPDVPKGSSTHEQRNARLHQLRDVRAAVERACTAYEDGRYSDAIAALRTGADIVAEAVAQTADHAELSSDSDTLYSLFVDKPRVGLWWWFLRQAEQLTVDTDGSSGAGGAARLDALLGVFFLAQYRAASAVDAVQR